jgi:hypothetical protein
MSQKVRQEIFSSLPAIDGRGEIRDWSGKMLDTPWTQEYRDYILKNELFPNTLEAIKLGVLLPVTETHHDKSPYLKGRMTSIYLAHKSDPIPHYVAIADMEVDDELASILDGGKLPGCSCEFVPYGDFTGLGGSKVGPYFTAVTYNGSAPVAQPWLQRLDADLNDMGAIPFYAFTCVDKPRSFALPDTTQPTPQPKGTAMTPEEKAALFEEIKALIKDTCAEMMGADMTSKAEADPAEDDKAEMAANVPAKEPDASDSAIAAMQAQFAAMQLREMKAEFAAMGLESEVEKDFIDYAKKTSLDTAKALFSKLKPVNTTTDKPKPPARAQMIAGSTSGGTNPTGEQKRLFSAMKTQGYTDDQIKAILAKKQEIAKGMVTA